MFSLIQIIVTAISIGLGYYYYRKLNKDKKALPEPFGVPILGHLPFIGTEIHCQIAEWSKTYGKVFKLNLGGLKCAVLSDPDVIREAFNMAVFNGRPDLKSISILQGGKNGVVFSEGQVWLEQRKFAVRHLRDFGFGKKSMESAIIDEANELVEGLHSEAGKPISVQLKFSLAVLNSLWKICTNNRYSHNDPELNEILKKANDTFNASTLNPLLMFFPSFCERYPTITGWKKYSDNCTYLRNYFVEQISEHKKTIQENDPRDLIDTYLEEIRKTKDPDSSFYGNSGEKHLVALVADMFGAGSETSSSTLQWSILYLSQNISVQRKFRKEIEITIGQRSPSLDDRKNMPYTEALIMELLRISLIIPCGLMHTATSETEFHGYKIPKGYGIIINVYGIHNDTAVWGDPQNFRPERFLDENGDCVKKHDSLLTFSAGKRVCIGENLARDTIFLFLTSIFQKFEVIPEPGCEVSYIPVQGFVWTPKPFRVIFNEL